MVVMVDEGEEDAAQLEREQVLPEQAARVDDVAPPPGRRIGTRPPNAAQGGGRCPRARRQAVAAQDRSLGFRRPWTGDGSRWIYVDDDASLIC